jgi:hypothetical protein
MSGDRQHYMEKFCSESSFFGADYYEKFGEKLFSGGENELFFEICHIVLAVTSHAPFIY